MLLINIAPVIKKDDSVMMIIFSGPLCLLCFYLAYLCYRNALYKHTLVLGMFGFFLLVITVGFIGASYYTWDALEL